jgi:hypothetical protein
MTQSSTPQPMTHRGSGIETAWGGARDHIVGPSDVSPRELDPPYGSVPCETQEVELASIAPRLIPGKGRGVVALRSFAAGDTIERCPVIVLPAADVPQIVRTRLASYYYEWGDDCGQGAIALGCGSLYNHSYEPNARYEFREEADCIEFLALRDIAPGDEITVNYNHLDEGDEGFDDPMPFDVR